MITSFELAGNIVGVMVDKDVTKEYLEELHSRIEEKLKEHDQINLFCEIMPGNEVPLKMLLKNLQFKFEHSKQINKMAMVTDLAWIRGIMDLDKNFVSTEIECFHLKDRLEAIHWISL
ncbi:SpoIIAA-like protein [Christiangramia gaetbulicola]|uniref:SpoIIAA-like protein n=1 Tax=Christiangramia gaetbulicola TaxID=703340 RepID=A0A2T6ACU6_9FLAO|nr:STAS/SEC14 domain-containing protein [Christiangramia gaetbulicola]PTX41628.1 SpoIIAA-like protein [Christiangramia gaetbulicola]